MTEPIQTMSRPRLLDLFAGAGGAARGYQLAGFYVVGVDIEPQPRYAGDDFIQEDALEVLTDDVTTPFFDAIHASPPCQMYSRALKHLSAPQPMLIEVVRERLIESGLPWVIENVEGAPLPKQSTLMGDHGVELCGTMFGLPVWRHRLFECSFPVEAPRGCDHRSPAMNPHNQFGRDRIYEDSGRGDPEVVWRAAMGVGWMNKHEGRESIPPAMTHYIGCYLAREVIARRDAERRVA